MNHAQWERLRSTPPACEQCGQPAYNVNRDGEHTGRHTNIEECLREMGRRIVSLERRVRSLEACAHGGGE